MPFTTHGILFRVLVARETPDRFPKFHINLASQLEPYFVSTQLKIIFLTETPMVEINLVLLEVRPESLGI